MNSPFFAFLSLYLLFFSVFTSSLTSFSKCKAIIKSLCKDQDESKNCDDGDAPKCLSPCLPGPDPEVSDMYKLDEPAHNFWARALASAGAIDPQLRLFGCVQADISLLEISGIPATIQLGIYGQVGYNTGDKCFGWQVDASIGVFFG